MQVARNFYLSTEKTFTRKIYEILLALKIESQLTKEQILEVYMNQIYLGQRAYGFASASEIYFGKPLKDITVAEAAMLAGLPKAPSAYNPIVNPERATQRQRYIIDRMLDNGFITRRAARRSARRSSCATAAPTEVAVHAEYVAETARQLIFSQYGDEAYTRGLNVYLTLDSARADGGLPRAAQGHHGLRAAAGLSRPRGLRRPAGQSEGARRAHRRGAARPSRQRRAEGRRRASRRRRRRWSPCCRTARRSRSPATA